MTNAWIKCYDPRPNAELALLCLPYAGGGASLFRDWSKDLPPAVEVRALQPPGREERLLEEPFDSVGALADALAEVVAPELDRPWAVFGHSMGALTAFELVRRLRERGVPTPVHFFASAFRAPQLACPVPTIHELPADEFLTELNRRYDAVPAAAMESAELLELFLPGLRADVAICDTYAYTAGPPLDLPGHGARRRGRRDRQRGGARCVARAIARRVRAAALPGRPLLRQDRSRRAARDAVRGSRERVFVTHDMSEMKRVFIVGCPRSGSTWTTFLMAQHPAVATFQHAKVFDYLVGMKRWYRNKTGYSFIVEPRKNGSADDKNLRLAEVLSEDDLFALLRGTAAGIFDKVASIRDGVTTVVDKTPENGHLGEFILNVFPDAYFLHIVRDPRSVYCSHRSASKSWARWEFPTRPADGGRFWRRDVETAMTIADRTERYLQVRYEDLKDNGEFELQRIFDWLELPCEADFCESTLAASTKDKVEKTKELPAGFVRKVPKRGWRDELKTGDVRILEYLAGDLMERLGYERSQPRGSKPLRLALSDLPVPLLSFAEKKIHRASQLALWFWVGRKLEWEEP